MRRTGMSRLRHRYKEYDYEYDDHERAEMEAYFDNLGDPRQVMVFLDDCDIGKKLKCKRVFDGFTQSELAHKLKLSVCCLSYIENGKRGVPKRRLPNVEQYLFREWYVDKQLIYSYDEFDNDEGSGNVE